MTQVSEIIEESFREAGLLTELQYPTPVQNERALTRLQALIAAVYGNEVGEPLEDWDKVRNTSLPEFVSGNLWSGVNRNHPLQNVRIIITTDMPTTLQLPIFPDNGARLQIIDIDNLLGGRNITLAGNGRLIESADSLVLSTNGINKTWIYDSRTANWGLMSGIVITSDMPFPEEFDDYFITSLAMRLAPRYEAELGQATILALNKTKSQLRARYRNSQEMPSECGLWPRNIYGWFTAPWR